jgi:cytochrome P450
VVPEPGRSHDQVVSGTDVRTVNYRPGEVLRWLYRHRGEVVRLPGVPTPVAYLFGPQANAFVFAHDQLFQWRDAFKGLIPVDGSTALIVSDGADHDRRRALVRPALHHRQVAGYVSIMAQTTEELLADVAPGTVVDGYALFRRAIRRTTIRSLFGERIAAHEDEVGRHLQPLFDLTDHLQTITARERLGTPLWRRAVRARERLDEFVYGEIGRARETSAQAADSPVLAMLVHGRDGDGSGLDDAEIRDQVVSMIAAGYETTSAAMAWTLYALAGRPDVLAEARAEVAAVCGGDAIRAEHLPRFTLLSAIVTEALRLYPPAVISARSVATGFTFAGATLRPGTIAMISPYVTHRDPDLYRDPDQFQPERWADGARRSQSEYLPFGGGAHRCIGSSLATTELIVMLAQLLARSGYRVVDTRVRATSVAAMRPRHGLRVELD